VKKWIITILAALAALALALTAHWWAPWLLSFATQNSEDIDHLNALAELVSKLVMWPLTAILFIISLWLKRKEDAVGRQSAPATNSGRDTNTAGRDIQTGGASVKGNASVSGDVFGGDKRIEGDSFTGDKTTTTSGTVIKAENVTINQGVLPASAPQLNSLHQLPPPPADFTGRTTELAELRAAIEKGGVHISGLQGQGGVGKTALALKLAAELAPNYPDAQIYLDLKGVSERPLTAAEAMSHVLRTFHPEAKLPEKEEDLRAIYLSVLHNKRALLLMDNAKDAAQVKPLIPPAGCTLLVTSRQHFALPGLQAKNLETLPPLDAKDLLLRIAPRIKGEAEPIAKLCGYLPQALRLAASAIAVRVDLDPRDYAKQLTDEKKRLELLAGDDESVTASITLSYNFLDEEMRRLWRMLAVFPDTFDTTAAAAVWEMEGDPAQNTLSHLLQFSMLEWNGATKRYRMHDLMRDFCLLRTMDAESDTVARRHATHYGAELAAADEFYLRGGESIMQGLALFDLERGNVVAGHDWAEAHSPQDRDAARLCSAYPRLGIQILHLRQHAREQIRWNEAGLAAARCLGHRASEGTHLSNLGIACDISGESGRAAEYFAQHLAIAREMGNRQSEGRALSNLGIAYMNLGDYPRAIEHLEQALLVDREIGDRASEGQALGNLGNTYFSFGDYRRAIEYHEQALAVDSKIGDRRGEGQDAGNLGTAYFGLGEIRRAIEHHEKALAISREVGDRRGEANTLDNLGNDYAALGETRRAIERYERSVAISRETGDRPSEGNSLWNMSLALDKLGDCKKAIEHADAALKIFEEIENPKAAKIRKQLDAWRNG
jgi:tetratricopeptide (TPR) repeat protein